MKLIAFSGCRDKEVTVDQIQEAEIAIRELHSLDTQWRCIVGDCPTGVDKSVRDYYKPSDDRIYKADWGKYKKAAGPIRNKAMIKDGDALIAFWDGNTPGTRDCIKHATDKGIPVLIMPVEASE